MEDKNMKSNKKLVALVMAIVMVVNFSIFGAIQVFAHDAMLNVDYDDCKGVNGSDDIDETWYVLDVPPFCYHLGDEVDTIKYYFEETSSDGTYTWTTDVTESVAQEIKTAYANSMKKWNNVYFYSYNDYGVLIKHKIINIVEGTEADHNLTIYPVTGKDFIAETGPVGTKEEIESGTISHRHYSEWMMNVNVDYFYVHGAYSEEYISLVRERNGAHEFGHVLGLRDVDSSNLCNATTSTQHHHELLMGYGSPMVDRAVDITYKDIAGVAITRGFHTDSDHRWLNWGLQSNGKYKLVCSICNGIEETASLSGYTYETYRTCGDNHSLSSGNMMAVASYGTKDYYKCKYCRYVAPFSSIVAQNYSKTYYSDTLHKCVNTVAGLEYTFYEEHTIVDHECTECGEHIHSYTHRYVWLSEVLHKSCCECGEYNTSNHVVTQGSFTTPDGYAICLLCRGRVLVGVLQSVPNRSAHTDNGSFILTNGTIVLVEADIDAYIAGTLEFYYGEKE